MVNEEKIRDDFKKKIKNLSEFYEQLNKKYNFARLDKRDLLHKLKDMNSNIQKNKEIKEKMDRFYIPCCKYK